MLIRIIGNRHTQKMPPLKFVLIGNGNIPKLVNFSLLADLCAPSVQLEGYNALKMSLPYGYLYSVWLYASKIHKPELFQIVNSVVPMRVFHCLIDNDYGWNLKTMQLVLSSTVISWIHWLQGLLIHLHVWPLWLYHIQANSKEFR